jgi:hypothetical protein
VFVQRQNSTKDGNKKKKLTVDLDRLVQIEESLDFSSSSGKSVTQFEDLSNKIIYEVFEFLDFCHIYDALFNLSIRFQNLLTRSSLPMNIDLSSMSSMVFQRYYTTIVIHYQHRIKSLNSSNPFINGLVFSSLFFVLKFTRLEQLTLDNINSLRVFPH